MLLLSVEEIFSFEIVSFNWFLLTRLSIVTCYYMISLVLVLGVLFMSALYVANS